MVTKKEIKIIIKWIIIAWIVGFLTGSACMYIIMHKNSESYAGIYNVYTEKTTIFHKNMEIAQYPQVVFHEFAHHLWHEVLNEKEKKIWMQYYSKNQTSISKYGEKNAEEDFAERYANSIICRWDAPKTKDLQKDIFIRNVHIDYQVVPNQKVWG